MAMHTDSIRPIYDMPDHRHYGPVRRLWMMMEQIFADRGGVRTVEVKIAAHNDRRDRRATRWDDHMSRMLDGGLPECAAQRTVMQQMLVADEFLA